MMSDNFDANIFLIKKQYRLFDDANILELPLAGL
jgi:hypothetical protein